MAIWVPDVNNRSNREKTIRKTCNDGDFSELIKDKFKKCKSEAKSKKIHL
jgi:hypothetical protein